MPSGAKRRDVRREWTAGLIAAVVVAAMVALGVWRLSGDDRPAVCDALSADVLGVESVAWDNGVTAVGGSWYGVLTDGPVQVDPDQQAELAQAVADDDAGFERLVGRLDEGDAAAATRLRDLVLDTSEPAAERRVDPDPQAADRTALPEVEADIARLRTIIVQTCGDAP